MAPAAALALPLLLLAAAAADPGALSGSALPRELAAAGSQRRRRGSQRRRSSGAGSPTLAFHFPGRAYSGSSMDYDDLSSQLGNVELNLEASFAFRARFDAPNNWTVLDIRGLDANSHGVGLQICSCGGTGDDQFCVIGAHAGNTAALAEDLVTTGSLSEFLITIRTTAGELEVFKDGVLMASTSFGPYGQLQEPWRATSLFVGRHQARPQAMHGLIENLRIWNGVVTWQESISWPVPSPPPSPAPTPAPGTETSGAEARFVGCWNDDQIPGWPGWDCTAGAPTYYVYCDRMQGTHEQMVEECLNQCNALGYAFFDIHDTTACFCGSASNDFSSPPNDQTGGCYNHLYKIVQAPTACSEVADQTTSGWFQLRVGGQEVEAWCDFRTEPGQVWRVGVFSVDVPLDSLEAYQDFCASRGFPDAGYGASANTSWLVQKRMLHDSDHPVKTQGWPQSLSVAMPLFGVPPRNIYDGMPAALPANLDGNHCDQSSTNFCGYWKNQGWSSDDASLPDPEGWAPDRWQSTNSFASCLHREKPAASFHVGPSSGRRTCLPGAEVFCPRDSAKQGKRLNRDHYGWPGDFDVSMAANGSVCVERMDADDGWSMDLELGCLQVMSGQVLSSCAEATSSGPHTLLSPDGSTRAAFCDAEHGGFELVMRARSVNSIFTYYSDHWVEPTEYGDQNNPDPKWQDLDVKYGCAFNSVPAAVIRGCLGHWDGSDNRCREYSIANPAPLLDLFRQHPATDGGLLLSEGAEEALHWAQVMAQHDACTSGWNVVGLNQASFAQPHGRVRFGALVSSDGTTGEPDLTNAVGFGAGEGGPHPLNVGAGWVCSPEDKLSMEGTMWIYQPPGSSTSSTTRTTTRSMTTRTGTTTTTTTTTSQTRTTTSQTRTTQTQSMTSQTRTTTSQTRTMTTPTTTITSTTTRTAATTAGFSTSSTTSSITRTSKTTTMMTSIVATTSAGSVALTATTTTLLEQTTSTTATTTTTTPPWVKTVVVRMTVENMNYNQLVANETLKASFVESVREEVALQAGPGIGPEHVRVALSEGSVAVNATIIPPQGTNVSAVESSISNSTETLAHSLIDHILEVEELGQVVTGELSVSSLAAVLDAFQLPPATQTTTTGTATTTTTTATASGAGVEDNVSVVFCFSPADCGTKQECLSMSGGEAVGAAVESCGEQETCVCSFAEVNATAIACLSTADCESGQECFNMATEQALVTNETCPPEASCVCRYIQAPDPPTLTTSIGPATTGPVTVVETVRVSMVVDNVNYNELMANLTLRDSFMDAVKEQVAETAGPVISPEHVQVFLSQGSVLVNATITPPPGTNTTDVESILSSSTEELADALLVQIESIPDISAVLTGIISVIGIDVDILYQLIYPSTSTATTTTASTTSSQIYPSTATATATTASTTPMQVSVYACDTAEDCELGESCIDTNTELELIGPDPSCPAASVCVCSYLPSNTTRTSTTATTVTSSTVSSTTSTATVSVYACDAAEDCEPGESCIDAGTELELTGPDPHCPSAGICVCSFLPSNTTRTSTTATSSATSSTTSTSTSATSTATSSATNSTTSTSTSSSTTSTSTSVTLTATSSSTNSTTSTSTSATSMATSSATNSATSTSTSATSTVTSSATNSTTSTSTSATSTATSSATNSMTSTSASATFTVTNYVTNSTTSTSASASFTATSSTTFTNSATSADTSTEKTTGTGAATHTSTTTTRTATSSATTSLTSSTASITTTTMTTSVRTTSTTTWWFTNVTLDTTTRPTSTAAAAATTTTATPTTTFSSSSAVTTATESTTMAEATTSATLTTTTTPAAASTAEPVARDVTISLTVEVQPPVNATGLGDWLVERVVFVETVLASLLGVPAEDVSASVGGRRLQQVSVPQPGAAVLLALAVLFRGTVAAGEELRGLVLRTVYGNNFAGGDGTGAFAGDGLTSALALELGTQGLAVPPGLAQAMVVGPEPVVLAASVTTTATLGNESRVPEPQEPPATTDGAATTVVLASAISVVSFIAAGLCSVWCWRNSRIVTRGQEDISGLHADFLIKRPECRQSTLLGRTFSLVSRERTVEGPKTVVSWQYDQDELLRRHASFQTRQLSERSPEDVLLDVAAPAADSASGNAGQVGEEEMHDNTPHSRVCPGLLFPAYPTGVAVEYFSRTHGRWAASVVARARVRPQSDDLLFDVRVGRQLRTEVTMANLRPILTEDMPVFACLHSWGQRQESCSPRRRRGPGIPRKTKVWRPAIILGPQKTFATRVGYRVRIEEDDAGRPGRALQLPAHRLRRRFPAGSQAEVYRGPTAGWVPAGVHAAAPGAVAAVRSDRSAAVDARASFRPGRRGGGGGGSSVELDAGFASFASFDTMDSSLASFSEELSPTSRQKYKDREEEGQLVPIVRQEDPEGEPEWVPGFLVRHPAKDSCRSDFI